MKSELDYSDIVEHQFNRDMRSFMDVMYVF